MSLPANLAVNPDEFLDYYDLLDLPQDATIAELRGRINDLYSESQANRDHRNPQKRREYLLWLDLLPQVRSIMTDDAKRAKYDEYRLQALSGAAVQPYPDFLRELEGKPERSEDESTVLGIREQTPATPVAATSTAPASSGGSIGPIAALGALVVVAGIAYAVTQNIGIALVAGAVVAAIVFIATRGGGNKIAS